MVAEDQTSENRVAAFEADAIADAAIREAGVNDTCRAIGRYIVEFSALIYRMRYVLSWRLTRGHDSQELGELAFAHAQAQFTADSYFSMCRFDGDLDEGEQAVLSALYGAVNDVITDRNSFAHGDWWTDLVPWRTGEVDATTLQLIRMQPKRRKGAFADMDHWSAEALDERAERMLRLQEDVVEFGCLALGLPVVVSNDVGGGVRSAEDREVRVRDVFTTQAGKGSGTKAQVLRNGPKADRVVRVTPASPV